MGVFESYVVNCVLDIVMILLIYYKFYLYINEDRKEIFLVYYVIIIN